MSTVNDGTTGSAWATGPALVEDDLGNDIDRALIPSTTRRLQCAVRASGARIFDEDGKDYIDASSGPLAVSLGHGHPAVARALLEQASSLDYVHRTQFRSAVVETYARSLVEILGPGLDHVITVSSGSEANEIAMKFAHMYWATLGRSAKAHFVSSDLSYHGNTVGALSSSGQPRYGVAFRPLLHDVQHIRAPKTFRLEVPAGLSPAEFCIQRLRDDFSRLDLNTTAAVLLESVGGSGSGVLVPPPGYLEELRRLCDEHEVLWIADEVMTGFGRTGTWFGFQHSSAVPDIVTFAKGAGAGALPLGGAAVSSKLWEQIRGTYPAMAGGHTFTNSPVACAVGQAVIDVVRREDLLAGVQRRGADLGGRLCELREEFSFIGDVRGRGFMWGLEFVADPVTLVPPDPALGITNTVVATAADHGLVVYPSRACHDGVCGDAVIVAPPLTTSEAEMDDLLERLRSSLDAMRSHFES